MSEKLLVVAGKRVIINVQFSRIGYGYPRLFIEEVDGNYTNLDLTVGAAFRMEKKDFEDWLEDAEVVAEEDYQKVVEESGMIYDAFVRCLENK